MVSDYLNNTSKYVYPLLIHEKNKDREIITYNLDQNGLSLRKYHEAIQNQKDIYKKANKLRKKKILNDKIAERDYRRKERDK